MGDGSASGSGSVTAEEAELLAAAGRLRLGGAVVVLVRGDVEAGRVSLAAARRGGWVGCSRGRTRSCSPGMGPSPAGPISGTTVGTVDSATTPWWPSIADEMGWSAGKRISRQWAVITRVGQLMLDIDGAGRGGPRRLGLPPSGSPEIGARLSPGATFRTLRAALSALSQGSGTGASAAVIWAGAAGLVGGRPGFQVRLGLDRVGRPRLANVVAPSWALRQMRLPGRRRAVLWFYETNTSDLVPDVGPEMTVPPLDGRVIVVGSPEFATLTSETDPEMIVSLLRSQDGLPDGFLQSDDPVYVVVHRSLDHVMPSTVVWEHRGPVDHWPGPYRT